MENHRAKKEFLTDNIRLMAEWDWAENEKEHLNPHNLSLGSGRRAHWICSKGHKWITTIDHRTIRGSNCPYCSNKKILSGYNDLKSQCPDLMQEWDFEANMLDPATVAPKSNKLAFWVCPKGHKYKKKICERAYGAGCPICTRALRTSFPEQCFYYYIRKTYLDAINSYRDVFDNKMELDIFIPSIKTGIEYDGAFWHNDNTLPREEKKYQICKEKNIRLFRIKENSPSKNFMMNADRIWYIPPNCDYTLLNFYITDFLKHLTFFSPYIPDVNVARDKNKILEYKTLKMEKSLAFLYPTLSKEWHPSKNGKLTPDLFTPGSSEVIWWLCPQCGNEWQATIANRTKGHGCDVCATAKRKTTKQETIVSKRGGIDKEWCLLDWDYETNEHGPECYTNGSGEYVHWRCHKCGYKWTTRICNRTRNYKNGCPSCSSKVIIAGKNDLPTLMPELMKEWDYEKNSHFDPTSIGVGSHLSVSWTCKKCGYHWLAKIYNRANGKGCPCCANRVVVPGINDLATTDPGLAAEWHPTLNTLHPNEVLRGQNIMIFWLCLNCGNVWKDTLNHRSGGRGCSKCKKKK